MDRLYASIPIAKWLLSRNITCVGTLQSNRLGIPDEVKSCKDREQYSSRMYWEKERGDFVITSNVVPTSKGQKNVPVLSTVEPIEGVTKDDGKTKPSIMKLYDFHKGWD